MYNIAEWSDLFVATAGAAAALAGLVTVAITVNIKEILRYKWLPDRAAATIGLLVFILVVSITGLVKTQSAFWFGIETIIFSLGAGWLTARVVWTKFLLDRKDKRPRSELVFHIATNLASVLPFMVGGVLLVCQQANGLYWIAAGIVAAFIISMLNAWVLLIEILR